MQIVLIAQAGHVPLVVDVLTAYRAFIFTMEFMATLSSLVKVSMVLSLEYLKVSLYQHDQSPSVLVQRVISL